MNKDRIDGTRRTFWKVKRFFRNLKFKLKVSNFFNLERLKPSFAVVTSIIIGLSIFFLIGGIYNIVEILAGRALALIPRTEGWTVVYPGSLHMQTINESLVVAFLYLLGIVGFYLLSKGVKLAYKPRQAYQTLIFGVMLILLITYYSSTLLQSKIGG